MYTQAQKQAALELFAQLKSITAVIHKLDYPSRTVLYNWIKQEHSEIEKKKKTKLSYKNTAANPLHPPATTKLEIIISNC